MYEQKETNMSRVSCKKLATLLLETDLLPGKLAAMLPEHLAKFLKSQCEAFGRDVQCFLYLESNEKRRQMERYLATKRIYANRNYLPECCVQIPVSYFKAWHWDE